MSGVEHYRGSDGGIAWEYYTREAPAHLAPFVREMNGYTEATPGLLQRREFAGGRVVLIFEFGPPLRVFGGELDGAHSHTGARRFARGFVAGIDQAFTLTEHDGYQCGMQINFTPTGARLFFGLPMSELSGRVIPFEDLAPDPELKHLAERLYDLGDWTARFALLQQVLSHRLVGSSEWKSDAGFAAIDWACGEIERRGGRVAAAEIAEELGFSRKHLAHLFRRHAGLSPGALGRVVRFQRLLEYLRSAGDSRESMQAGTGAADEAMRENWADLAARFGYYDQSHLIREVKSFAGRTPGRLHEVLNPVHGESARQRS
ncbi:MAG: helix-turn-helix domain-containing protein [bacterium]|nr:helix-turn-helix domain-containing protein [bacterium]